MSGIERLLAVMRRLRDPQDGCPWDLEQDFSSIAPYTIEEAYEVADAIERGDLKALEGELGDLLLQTVYHAEMASEIGAFDFEDVAAGITEKMIRRHPHVFGEAERPDARTQGDAWEEAKAVERAQAASGPASALDDVPVALPALARALKLQRRAARVGFDWPDAEGPRTKITEELAELDHASPDDHMDELGDLLFSVVNLARKKGIDAEAALRNANAKFERRFRRLEELADHHPERFDLDGLEALWQRAKAGDR